MKRNLIRFDWAIKRLLRNRANFGILEGFLSELLEDDIKIEEILESEGNQESADNKYNKVDMLVKNSKGELIIIEVQNDYQADYLLRMLFGTAKLVVDNMDIGVPYSKVKKVISIHIVYFDLGMGDDYVYYGGTTFLGRHSKNLLWLSKQEQEIFKTDAIAKIYPEYYIIKVKDFDNVSKDTLDEWISFLKTQEIKDDTKAKGLKEAKEKLDYLSLDEQERKEYERHIENWRDSEGIIVGNYNKGKYEGIEEGRRREKIETAKNCIKSGIGTEMITRITGLTTDEIAEIGLL